MQVSFNLSNLLALHGFPAQYLWALYAAMVVFGVLLMFYGRRMWQVLTELTGAIIGAYIGYAYVTPHIGYLLTAHGFPIWTVDALLALIFMVILHFIVQIGVSGGMGYLSYYILTHQHYLQHYIALTFGYIIGISIVVTIIAYLLYSRISILIAALVCFFAVAIGIMHFSNPVIGTGIAVAIFGAGLYWQTHKKQGLHDQEEKELAKYRLSKRIIKLEERKQRELKKE